MDSLKNVMSLISDILDIDQNIDGELYLKEFVKRVSKKLNIKYVLIGHPNDETLSTIQTDVVWCGDDYLDNFEYILKDSPCEIVLSGERVCIHPSNAYMDFPKDKLLKQMNIESYIGAPIVSKNKEKVSSILVLLDEKPLDDKDFYSVIVEFLALRAGAEIEKIQHNKLLEEKIKRRTAQLEFANIEIDELKLKQSEEKFKTLFELSPMGMAMVDHQTGEFLEVNKSLLETTGYTKEEFLSLSFWDITPQEYILQEQKQIEELNETGRFGPNEKEYIKKDGTKYPVKISGFTHKNIDGREVVWGIIEDISETKQYETIYKDQKDLLEYITIENDLTKIFDRIVYLAEDRNPETKCSILLLDDEKKHLLNGSAPSLPKFYNDAIHGIEIGEKIGSCGAAAFLKKRVIVDNIDKHENWQLYLELTNKANLHACWSEPIVSSTNEVLGTFAIYNEKPKKPTSFELKLIETYANIASKAIEKFNYNKEIKKAKEQLEKLFNNSQSGLLYINGNRILIKANQRFAEIMGYETPDEMNSFSMREFHLSQERYEEFGRNNFSTLISNKENFNIEYELRRKDGSAVWCELSGKALDNNFPADLSKGVLWTVNDISLRKKYEKELREKQNLLRNVLSTIPDMVWLKDTEGTYLMCNPEFESFFGAKEEVIVGKTDYDFVDANLADFFRQHDKNAMNSQKTLLNEEWVTYANSDKRVLLDTSKKAMRDNDGNIIGVLGIGHDVTDRKKKEEELLELNKLADSLTQRQNVLLSLFDNGDSTLFMWKNDEKWSVDYVSNSVTKLLGYKKEDFLSYKISYEECIHKDDLENVRAEVVSAKEKNIDYFKHKPYRVITKDNSEKWVLDYTVVQRDTNSDVIYFIGYITDITEQVKNQELIFQQSKVASIGEMLGNIAHQWRQPLSLISTVASGTKLKKEMGILQDGELYENMDNISEKTQYLSKTIDDFRNFFIEGNTSGYTKNNIKDSILKVISLVKDALKNQNIMVIESYEVEDLYIYTNENLLIQALINIINNAKDALNSKDKSSFSKYIFIELSKKEDSVLIKIKDNAGGIPSSVMNKIFEPYFTTKHQSQGTGIGLYMTNQIITKHLGSKINVQNEQIVWEDKIYTGAAFEILLKDKNK